MCRRKVQWTFRSQTGDPEQDPWAWRELIAADHQVAYGKFFDKKAGFISLEWLPYFANARRNGYDFDARWEDGLASRREKIIMDQLTGKDPDGDMTFPDRQILSTELKKAGWLWEKWRKELSGYYHWPADADLSCDHGFSQKSE